MKDKCTNWTTLAASIFVGGAMATSTQGQTPEALINTLIKKGVLTEKEAQDIRAEASKESEKQFDQAFSAKMGTPSWIKNYKLYGDFRGRFEETLADNAAYHTRDRYRIRLRLGLTMNMVDNFEVGLRLATGNPQFNQGRILVGGSPVTANQDLNSLESRKFLWLDAAYAKWTPIKTEAFTVSGTIGKMDNPFQFSNMIWDYDIAPEGAALQTVYNVNDHQVLKGTFAGFILDEFNQGSPTPYIAGSPTNSAAPAVKASHDPYLFGGQLLWDSKWTPKLDTTFGVGAFNIVHQESLGSRTQPFYNAGNTRNAAGFLVHHYDPMIGSGAATYKFPSFPCYSGQFPVKLSGEYMYNPSPSWENKAWRAGITVGKAGKKNTWEVNYRYQHLEADAWYDALVDDDNGVFYAPGNPQIAGTGSASGWFGGTNTKGHQVIGVYSFTDFLNLTFNFYYNDAIVNSVTAADPRSKTTHFMVDLNWKF